MGCRQNRNAPCKFFILVRTAMQISQSPPPSFCIVTNCKSQDLASSHQQCAWAAVHCLTSCMLHINAWCKTPQETRIRFASAGSLY